LTLNLNINRQGPETSLNLSQILILPEKPLDLSLTIHLKKALKKHLNGI